MIEHSGQNAQEQLRQLTEELLDRIFSKVEAESRARFFRPDGAFEHRDTLTISDSRGLRRCRLEYWKETTFRASSLAEIAAWPQAFIEPATVAFSEAILAAARDCPSNEIPLVISARIGPPTQRYFAGLTHEALRYNAALRTLAAYDFDGAAVVLIFDFLFGVTFIPATA